MTRNDSVYEGFKDELREILEQTIDGWFYRCQEELGISSGDVAPDEQFEYDAALEKLCICCRDMLKNQDKLNNHMPVNRFSIALRPDFISCAEEGTELAKLRDSFWTACEELGHSGGSVCLAAYNLRLYLNGIRYDVPNEIEAAYKWLDKTVQYYFDLSKEE